MVEKGTPGFSVAKVFSKIGRHSQDTCLLSFKDVKIPAENLIGHENQGFAYLMHNLPQVT